MHMLLAFQPAELRRGHDKIRGMGCATRLAAAGTMTVLKVPAGRVDAVDRTAAKA
jgi:hypothetical protein